MYVNLGDVGFANLQLCFWNVNLGDVNLGDPAAVYANLGDVYVNLYANLRRRFPPRRGLCGRPSFDVGPLERSIGGG